ncbi:NAD(P)/FAD-dependent oxidoreductase [Jeotgalibacillus terrae]|uniref:NAD(P)/FAD-dependent oxidoreductase n=1 Tax=Jeotgalibacillus terrae TaxID=587735 RepID=A0ABW5ZFK2_9BACL|nr:FAD-dependent oxidoreductase [Jeotgalibacillus terrae]MBM7579472.1 pyridine nucleotide-disulfide oxidoreductase family protein [Jeotgalibacillus terrae]
MKTVILAGGGHTHLEVLKRLSSHHDSSVKWILVSASRYHYYSGMFSGFAEGLYGIEDIRIDLKQLCENKHIHFIEASVESFDPEHKTVTLSDGERLTYDRLSLDIGSHTAPDQIEGLSERQTQMKPAHLFPDRIEACRKAKELVIIGGGAAACEMAFSFHQWKQQHGRKYDRITVIASNEFIDQRSDQVIEAMFEEKGIHFIKNDYAVKVTDRHVITKNDKNILYKEVIFLGGAQAPDLLKTSGLPVDQKGFIKVNAGLQTIDNSSVFSAGDCAALVTHPDLPKSGVYAVRQGEVLYHNLLASLNREPLADYTPQQRALILLSTGGMEALMLYGKWRKAGRWAWLWKDYIDRGYMRKYQ